MRGKHAWLPALLAAAIVAGCGETAPPAKDNPLLRGDITALELFVIFRDAQKGMTGEAADFNKTCVRYYKSVAMHSATGAAIPLPDNMGGACDAWRAALATHATRETGTTIPAAAFIEPLVWIKMQEGASDAFIYGTPEDNARRERRAAKQAAERAKQRACEEAAANTIERRACW